MSQRVSQISKPEQGLADSVRIMGTVTKRLDRLIGIPDGPDFKQDWSKVRKPAHVALKPLQFAFGKKVGWQIVNRVLQACQFPQDPPGGFAILRGTACNRLNRRNGLAGYEHRFQIKGAGERNQARNPEIDGTVLDLRDMALRHP